MKKFALIAFFPLLLLSIVPFPALAQTNTKIQDIHKMLVLSGSGKNAIQVMRQMLRYQQEANPEVPKEFWEEFMNEVDPNELIELIAPIYARYFSHEDVKAMIRFYESPVGKKLVSVQPLITRDSMSAGQQWGMAIGRKIARKLQEKGYR